MTKFGFLTRVPVIAALGTALTAGVAAAETRLQGSGATFPAPYYKRLVVTYQNIRPDVAIDYTSSGSGAGIRDITNKTVHFCGSDAPLSKKELEAIGGDAKVVEIPSCAGGVVPIYNVPGLNQALNFTGELLSDIYLGRVTKWSDPAIVKLNPGVRLPDQSITPVARSDGSGTTFIFTNYLGSQSEKFRDSVGMDKQVQWPVGQSAKGNEGVAAVVQQTVGGLGYVEQNYAVGNKLTYGAVKNKNGKFVKASTKAVSFAGAGVASKLTGTVLAANIWNQAGDETYPIASFTYLIVYKDLSNLPDAKAAQELADFLWWATHAGQKEATALDYAPLAPEVQAKVEAALKTLTYKGQPLKMPK